ncbi:pyridoxal-phosphate dependent enzyme [Rugamonas rubra]|uniref:Cysteine synthase n=1 Tax=Rugamonas rubra TaxID=758825 RepID=A0A1I4T046_9BURK|nr:pyridoxal-phosphate dependent enzyme [Rugamonas rubra]SFM70031.1 Cysteine synthase [Rugamonas rubra]
MLNQKDQLKWPNNHFSTTSIFGGTPSYLQEVEPGVLVKFECNNPGGSHKVRAARYIIQDALQSGSIVQGQTTVIEKTGGNFGFGLIAACSEFGVPVELAVGLNFSPTKRRCLELFGATLIGVEMLKAGSTPREVVEWHQRNAENLGKQYFYTDQFSNPGNVKAHEYGTGAEIVSQLQGWPTVESIILVAGAGTGASLTGIARSLLSAHYDVEVILVEPEGCDSQRGVFIEHRFEGIAVGVSPPLLDWSLVTERVNVDFTTMIAAQNAFAGAHGYFIGNTSAACFAVARKIAGCATNSRKILSLIYDHGLWYFRQ